MGLLQCTPVLPHFRRSLGHSRRPAESAGPGWEGGAGKGLGTQGAQTDSEAEEPAEDGTTGHVVLAITVLWQVGCSGHAPPQTVEFAPPSPLATAGRADGVSRLTNQVRRRPTTGHSPHPPQPPVRGKGSLPPPHNRPTWTPPPHPQPPQNRPTLTPPPTDPRPPHHPSPNAPPPPPLGGLRPTASWGGGGG